MVQTKIKFQIALYDKTYKGVRDREKKHKSRLVVERLASREWS